MTCFMIVHVMFHNKFHDVHRIFEHPVTLIMKYSTQHFSLVSMKYFMDVHECPRHVSRVFVDVMKHVMGAHMCVH